MTKRQDLCLQRRSRPEQSDQRQPNQANSISHEPRASPDSTALTSRIEFPTMTAPGSDSHRCKASGEPRGGTTADPLPAAPPLKAHLSQIKRIDKYVDHANAVALVNEIIEAFGQ